MSQEKPQPKYFSRKEFVERLQQTIEQLNGILDKVNQESIETWPDQSIVDTLTQTTTLLDQSLITTPVIVPPSPPDAPAAEEAAAEATSGIDKVLPSFNSLQAWWDGVLATVRSLLPPAWGEKVSDWVLTGILTGTVVALLLASVLVFFPSAAPISEIAASPPSPEETPLELTAPDSPQPVVLAPLPEPPLTPEQSLIAALQEALNDLLKQYPEGLITGMQADFAEDRLVVTLGDGWYELSPSRQDSLANYIWQRSRRLDFKNVEMLSGDRTLIARNPVIGEQVIILERQREQS